MGNDTSPEPFSKKFPKEPEAKRHAQAHQIIELYWFNELPIADVADNMNLSIGRVSQLMDGERIPRKPLSEQRKDRGALRWDSERLQYLDWLTPKQQKTIREVVLEGRTLDEIAEEEDISADYLSDRFRRAIDSLETIAEDRNDSG